MATKTKKTTKKQKQLQLAGVKTERPNRIPEIDKAAEAYRLARNKRQEATKVELEKKTILKDLVKKHDLVESYLYDDEDGETEEVKPIREIIEDVKVNKVKQKPDGKEG